MQKKLKNVVSCTVEPLPQQARISRRSSSDADLDDNAFLLPQPKPRTQPAELPVSLPTSAKSPAASSSSTAINPASTASGWEDPSQDGSASTSSKIEAARQFLKQVRMDDDLPPSTAPGEKDELPEPPQPLPARFPGESGGFLREVSTKRTGTGTGIASQRQSKVPASDTRVPTPSQPPQPSPPPHLTRTYPAPSLTRFQSSPNAPTPSRGALSTASALSFGSSSHSASTSAPRGPGQSRSIGLPTPQLSAFEFARRWREAGRLSDGSGSGGAQAQVHFLQVRAKCKVLSRLPK